MQAECGVKRNKNFKSMTVGEFMNFTSVDCTLIPDSVKDVNVGQYAPVVTGKSLTRGQTLYSDEFKVDWFYHWVRFAVTQIQSIEATTRLELATPVKVVVPFLIPCKFCLWAFPCNLPNIKNSFW